MNNKSVFLLLFLLSTGVSGCLDSEEYDFDKLGGIEVNPTYAIPLAQGSLGLQDLLNEDDSATLGVREDQVLFFHYDKSFNSNDINQLLTLPDVSVNESLTLPADAIVPANSEITLFEINSALSLSAGSQQFRTVRYKAGRLAYQMSTTMNVPLEVTISFPAVTKSGSVLTADLNLNGATGMQAAGESDLTAYEADLTTGSPAYNMLPFTLSVTAINATSSDITINQGESVAATINFVDQDYERATGFFGEITHDFPALTLPIGPFNDMLKFDVHLAEIDLQMDIINEYGIPARISFPVFEAVNESGEKMNIQTDPPEGITIASPTAPGEQTENAFNIQNEVEVTNFNPVQIRYSVRAQLNEGLSAGDNFILDSSRLTFNLSADIPLIGSFKEIVMSDTLDVNLSEDLGEETDIKSLALRTALTNEFPFQGSFQIYTLDSEQRVTDSLLTEDQAEIIPGSQVTATGDLSHPGEYDELLEISGEKFDKLIQASQVIIKAKLGTIPGENNEYPNVKFKANYTISVSLGILAEFETTIEP